MSRILWAFATLFVFTLFTNVIFAQTNKATTADTQAAKATGDSDSPSPNKPYANGFRVDLNARVFIDPLPFDVPFKIVGVTKDESLISVKLYYVKGIKKVSEITDANLIGEWQHKFDQQTPFLLRARDPLEPNTNYTFLFKVQRNLLPDERSTVQNLISSKLTLLMQDKLVNKTGFNFTQSEITTATQEILNLLNNALALKGLRATTNLGPSQYYNLVQNSIAGLSNVYTHTFSDAITILYNNHNYYNQVIGYLDAAGPPGEASALQIYTDIKNGLHQLYSFTVPAHSSLSDVEIDNLLQSIKLVSDNNKAAAAPSSMPFKNAIPNIDELMQELKIKLTSYKTGTATAKPITDKYASDLTDELTQIIYQDILVTDDDKDNTYMVRSDFYLSADIGVALFPGFGRASPYLGTNIYLRPVNKDRPIYQNPYNVLRCFSFLVAVSFVSIAETGHRDDLIGGSFNLLGGIGYRITDNIRLNGGFILYDNLNANPLSGSQSLAVSGFASLSFDWDISSSFKSIFGSIKKTD